MTHRACRLQRGDRECQIVILCEDDLIEWDDDYPPQLGQEEDKAQSTSSDRRTKDALTARTRSPVF